MQIDDNFSTRLIAWRERLERELGRKVPAVEAGRYLDCGRSYYSELENGRKPGRYLRRKFEEIENLPATDITRQQSRPAEPVVSEAAPDYKLVKKVIYIREHGSKEQIALLDSFLDSVCTQLDLPRADQSPGKSDRS